MDAWERLQNLIYRVEALDDVPLTLSIQMTNLQIAAQNGLTDAQAAMWADQLENLLPENSGIQA